MSSNSQTITELATLKDSEPFKYFNQIKTHKRDRSIYISKSDIVSKTDIIVGMKRKRED